MSTALAPAPVRNAFRSVEGALLAVHLTLAVRYLRIVALQSVVPVQDHFFPAWLRHPAVLLLAFFAPILTEAMVLQRPGPGEMKRAALVETVCAALLLVHQATYFYATWVVVFWASLLLIWMAWSAAADAERASTVGPFLAQLSTAFF